jgi:hypothetical protein
MSDVFGKYRGYMRQEAKKGLVARKRRHAKNKLR